MEYLVCQFKDESQMLFSTRRFFFNGYDPLGAAIRKENLTFEYVQPEITFPDEAKVSENWKPIDTPDLPF